MSKRKKNIKKRKKTISSSEPIHSSTAYSNSNSNSTSSDSDSDRDRDRESKRKMEKNKNKNTKTKTKRSKKKKKKKTKIRNKSPKRESTQRSRSSSGSGIFSDSESGSISNISSESESEDFLTTDSESEPQEDQTKDELETMILEVNSEQKRNHFPTTIDLCFVCPTKAIEKKDLHDPKQKRKKHLPAISRIEEFCTFLPQLFNDYQTRFSMFLAQESKFKKDINYTELSFIDDHKKIFEFIFDAKKKMQKQKQGVVQRPITDAILNQNWKSNIRVLVIFRDDLKIKKIPLFFKRLTEYNISLLIYGKQVSSKKLKFVGDCYNNKNNCYKVLLLKNIISVLHFNEIFQDFDTTHKERTEIFSLLANGDNNYKQIRAKKYSIGDATTNTLSSLEYKKPDGNLLIDKSIDVIIFKEIKQIIGKRIYYNVINVKDNTKWLGIQFLDDFLYQGIEKKNNKKKGEGVIEKNSTTNSHNYWKKLIQNNILQKILRESKIKNIQKYIKIEKYSLLKFEISQKNYYMLIVENYYDNNNNNNNNNISNSKYTKKINNFKNQIREKTKQNYIVNNHSFIKPFTNFDLKKNKRGGKKK
ncbi:peptidyl-prolyl cis-trans isomerase cyp63 [Anaeramoeba flamelloides]|uniref:Peptidyl-prolyl cis-trans isomerase cyp63 n=1 Tax=Anaeramoeba flamelloides TaxID=1746091 RepID=A0AAV7ZJI7_9EUKA|nr:peptidyl-prolyl cis-trans isomerase cyp63 [Anaeramoeba flamelloides]